VQAIEWVDYLEMELENDNFSAAENIFGRSLLTVPNVVLWSTYLNYIRRRNDLTNDVAGTARQTITQSYDFVLSNIGIDKDSGKIWKEYIEFIRNAPGTIGGNSWQDQQKGDQLRKAYQKAVVVPMSQLSLLWKEYDQFEMSLNKITVSDFHILVTTILLTPPRGANSSKRNHLDTCPREVPTPPWTISLET
jgi:cleavage stimulation factor subunit 3